MVEVIVILGCALPVGLFIVAIFACELRYQYRKNKDDRDLYQ